MPEQTQYILARTAAALRGLLAVPSDDEDNPWRTVILKNLTGPDALEYAAHPERGAAQPCPVPFRLAHPPLFVSEPEPTRESLAQAVAAYAAQHGGARPQAVAVQGLGVFYQAGDAALEGPPLHNRIAVVTGAAGAIGHGICAGLLAQGAWVVAADISAETLKQVTDEFEATHPGRILGITMDVTSPASVEAGFASVCETWGGLDILVINAGIAHVAALTELPLETFQKLERVNVDGTLLTLTEAARIMQRQATGGDMILVSSKNVFAPGARFGAYSATKAASHQLARIASLELAEFGIRVNMVSPDGIFSSGALKSGLWATVGPDRMKARGLDEKGLEDYYKNRNLLKARVTARHVANAVLFFATRQTPTTGATIPVDGGLPDATPR